MLSHLIPIYQMPRLICPTFGGSTHSAWRKFQVMGIMFMVSSCRNRRARQELKRRLSLQAILTLSFLKGLDPPFQNFANVLPDAPGVQTARIVLRGERAF